MRVKKWFCSVSCATSYKNVSWFGVELKFNSISTLEHSTAEYLMRIRRTTREKNGCLIFLVSFFFVLPRLDSSINVYNSHLEILYSVLVHHFAYSNWKSRYQKIIALKRKRDARFSRFDFKASGMGLESTLRVLQPGFRARFSDSESCCGVWRKFVFFVSWNLRTWYDWIELFLKSQPYLEFIALLLRF